MASGLECHFLTRHGGNIFNLLPADQFVFGTSCYRLTSSAGGKVLSFDMEKGLEAAFRKKRR